MKNLLTSLCLSTALLAPALAQARPVTITTQLKSYGGEGAYLALYLTDSQGAYQGTLWFAGGKSKYYKHLTDWYRATGGSKSEIDGITGASVGSGSRLTVTIDLADALIDAGYQIRVDSSVENGRDNGSEIVVPLTQAAAGKPVSGRGYIASFQFDM